MYTDIQQRRDLGFGKSQVAQQLGLNYRTVSRYWDMSAEEFECSILIRKRKQCLELYEGIIFDWLKQQPGLTGAEVWDRLKEHYDVQVSERSVRRLVGSLRKKHNIPKSAPEPRQYSAVEELPMGKQMQVDLGVAFVEDIQSRTYRKVFVVAGVLSHSRYKWGGWYTSPLTSAQFVTALEDCFDFFGGITEEIVFDQDRLLAVDENFGDIIYTKEFEAFRQRMGFKVYLCLGVSGNDEA
jgi:transposase